MATALVLTEEAAAELGWVGAGPFTFAGVFPGEYLVDRPLEVRFLGFDGEDAAREAFETAFADAEVVPLEWVDVEPGEGLPLRENHALSEAEARQETAETLVEEARTIRTHADADALAEELGITFPEGAKLDEKRDAIAAFRGAPGTSTGTVAGDPNELTPALGAEETTPGEGEAGATPAATAETQTEETE
jgi:hypothetical protein